MSPSGVSQGDPRGVPGRALILWGAEEGAPPAVVLSPNLSGRFESRFVTVRVEAGPALMLRGMGGTRLGVWVAHGEGGCWAGRGTPGTGEHQELWGLWQLWGHSWH